MAANFRSTCDSERGAPESSTQLSPGATPHVGHRTDATCLGVSSLFFISDSIRLHAAANLSKLGQSYGTGPQYAWSMRMTDVAPQPFCRPLSYVWSGCR